MSAQKKKITITKWIRKDNRIESTNREWFEPVGSPWNSLCGDAAPEGIPFSWSFRYIQRGRISRKEVYKFDRENWHSGVIIHCQFPRETVLFSRGFCPDVSRDEVEENISNRGKTAVNWFPEEPDIISHKVSVVLFLDFHFNSGKKITEANQNSRLASVLY